MKRQRETFQSCKADADLPVKARLAELRNKAKRPGTPSKAEILHDQLGQLSLDAPDAGEKARDRDERLVEASSEPAAMQYGAVELEMRSVIEEINKAKTSGECV